MNFRKDLPHFSLGEEEQSIMKALTNVAMSLGKSGSNSFPYHHEAPQLNSSEWKKGNS